VRAGDYVEAQLAERMDVPKLVGDIVSHWHRLADRRRTIVFAVNVEHSVHLRNEFQLSGVAAEHLDGSTPAAERDAILARFAKGTTEVVCNVGVLTEGWDLPEIGCVIVARPTKSFGLYRQMVGRGLRPGRQRLVLVLDHAGVTLAWPGRGTNFGIVARRRRAPRSERRRPEAARAGGRPHAQRCWQGDPCIVWLATTERRSWPWLTATRRDRTPAGRAKRRRQSRVPSSANVDRHRARLQAGLGGASVPAEVQALADGSKRRAADADARATLVGAQPADRLG
jgi:superfamily II DNA or RNA helicase